jgi:hypothetical protein
MKSRWLLIAGGLLLGAALLAYSFAETVRQAVILPVLYFLWRAAQFYHAIPQQLVWAALIVIVVYFVGSMLVDLSLAKGQERETIVRRGRVESLAQTLDRRNEGTYFKWQVANLLGELALDILTYQERLLPGRRLQGRGWQPPREVARYLDAGLNTTFADYPASRPLGKRMPSPNFDTDLDLVLDYVESQLEPEGPDDHTG